MFGPNYPLELVRYITMFAWKKIKISCSWFGTAFLIDCTVHYFGSDGKRTYAVGNIKSIQCMNGYIICMSDDKNVYVWGNVPAYNRLDIVGGYYYKSGYKYTKKTITKIKVRGEGNTTAMINSNNSIYFCDNVVDHSIQDIHKLRCGIEYIMILTRNGALYSFGLNSYGQLGYVKKSKTFQKVMLDNVIRVECGGYHTIALTSENKLYGWGRNEYGNLGLGDKLKKTLPTEIKIPSLSKILSICCGADHTMILLDNDEIYVWGYNEFGQLGIGSYDNMLFPVKLNLLKIRKLYSCGNHNVAVDSYNNFYVWGMNDQKQLGLSDDIDRYVPVKLTLDF